MLLYGEWVEQNVLAPVAHRQYVFTLPKLLRPIFSRHRAWLGELCRIAARLLTDAYTAAAPGARPGHQYAGQGVKYGLVKKEDANLDAYVTQKALDGLFVMVAEEEVKIRQNPAAAASAILKKVFGALK